MLAPLRFAFSRPTATFPRHHNQRIIPKVTRMIRTTCHCGAVSIAIPRQPEALTNCDCSICRRYGPLWAYFQNDEVETHAAPEATQEYSWGKKSIAFVRCRTCGCITHWKPLKASRGKRMGVNARNFEPEQLGPVRIRLLDGAVTEAYVAEYGAGNSDA